MNSEEAFGKSRAGALPFRRWIDDWGGMEGLGRLFVLFLSPTGGCI